MIAAGIKQILYAEPSVITADLTALALKTLIADNIKVKSVSNVHGDTWTLDETEASATSYKNALNGKMYRRDSEPGEVKANFTIGEYDYQLKADLLGGEVIKQGNNPEKVIGWKRGDFQEKHKTMIFLTKDDQYCVFPYASLTTREANTDKAIGLAVAATPLEPKITGVSSEYWFDKTEVDTAVVVG